MMDLNQCVLWRQTSDWAICLPFMQTPMSSNTKLFCEARHYDVDRVKWPNFFLHKCISVLYLFHCPREIKWPPPSCCIKSSNMRSSQFKRIFLHLGNLMIIILTPLLLLPLPLYLQSQQVSIMTNSFSIDFSRVSNWSLIKSYFGIRRSN